LLNEEDMRLPGQPAIGLSNLNENMYLVVRSLKNNNEKTVSKNFWLNLLGLRNSGEGHFENWPSKVCGKKNWLCKLVKQNGS
jgi:hypothetical protein